MSPEQLPSKIGKSVGEKLRAARIAQHYTQSQLAAPDFSVSYISAIERGQIHPSLRALEILAARLGLSSTQLLPHRSQQDPRHSASLGIVERDDDEIELTFLDIEVLLWQGSAAQAIQQLGKISTKRLKRQHQLQHRYLLGWAYFSNGRYQECEYTLSDALQVATELNNHYISLRILNLLALSQAALRNYTQALLAHERCLHMLETVEPLDPFFHAQVYMHMGYYYTQLENYEQAVAMFNKALTFTGALTTSQAIQAVYQRICAYYNDSKEYTLAALYAYKSLHVSTLEEHKRLQGELHHYLGQAILSGDPEQARAYLDEALQKGSNTQDKLTRASILTQNAEWYIAQENLAEAEGYAQQAYELSHPFGETLVGAEALIVLGRIKCALADFERGDRYMVAGLNMLEKLGSHEELANESVLYAENLEERGKEHEAFVYFKRAFQSRQRLGR